MEIPFAIIRRILVRYGQERKSPIRSFQDTTSLALKLLAGHDLDAET